MRSVNSFVKEFTDLFLHERLSCRTPSGESCCAYAPDQYNNKIPLGRIDCDGSYKIGLDFINPNTPSGSTFYVIFRLFFEFRYVT